MALNSFLKIFMPKNKIFYELFEKVADNASKMGSLLRDIVAEPDFDKRASLILTVEDLEHANDELTHNIFTELGRNFITPFDREDIHYLATSLDDIADYIYAAAKKINFYRVNPNDMGMQKFAELIEQDGIDPAPYAARYHWVALQRFNVLSEKDLKALLRNAYELVLEKLPKRTRAELEGKSVKKSAPRKRR